MAKTYDLTGELHTGRLTNSDWVSDAWTNFWYNSDDPVGYSGFDSPRYYATNILFNSTTLSSLRTKVSNGVTVTGLTLTVQCAQAMTGETYIGYKYNSTASGNSSSAAWARSTNVDNPGSASDTGDTLAYKIPAQSLSTGQQTFNLYRSDPDSGVARPFSGIPKYGLVAGPRRLVSGRWRFTSATLHVTTNEFTVNYYKGSNGTGNNVTDVIASGGSLRGATYTRTGYTQTGWATSDGGAKVYNLSATYSGPSDVLNLYPYWTAVTYTVTYNKGTADGATGSQQTDTKTYGVDLTLKNAIFTRTGYTQQGWSTASAGNSKAYELGSNGGRYTNNAAITLYPYWVANTYAVTYNANGGSGTTASQTKTYGQSLPLRANGFARTGYAFQHWNTKADGTGTTYAAGASYTANAAVTLYAIWLATASTVSTTNGTLGTAQTITITRSSSSYTHNLSCTYGTQTITDFATDVGTSFSWTPPPSLAAGFPNATSGTCTITCVTNSGSTTIGTTTTTCTLTIPDTADYRPSVSTFTATHHSSNSAVNAASWGGAGNYTKGYSYATLSVANGYTLKGGATLKSIVFSGPGVTAGSGTSTSTNTSVLTAPYPNNSCTWTVTVTDSRNRTASKTVSVTVYDYAPPTVSGITVHRCNADGTINDSGGEYLWIKPTFSLSSVNSKNSWSSRTLKYTLHGSSTSLGSKSCASGTEYKPTGTQWSVALTNAYDVTVTVVDAVQAADDNNTTLTVTLPTVQGIWFGKGNDRLGLGGVPEGAGLWCDWDATFKGVVDVVPRRCYAPISSEGWYRVMVFDGSSSWVAGGIGFTVDITLFDWARQATRITLWGVAGALKFANEQSISYLQMFDKIRYMQNGGYGYIDVHYTAVWGDTRYMACYFDVKQTNNATYTPAQFESWWTAVNFTPVASSPSGETQLALYTFVANTGGKITFTPSNCSVYRTCWYARIGNVCYLHIDISGLTANTNTYIFTLPVGFRPGDYMALRGSGQESWSATARATISTSGDINIYSTDRYALVDGSFICVT
ncbi:MAG: InlB B-repeat-containing protein [Clostridia bacterium]|nr:InlB B-repeat-containing protein [Clostridia bacterium]